MKLQLFLILYYSLCYHLPDSDSKPFGKISRKIRRWVCKHIFLHCGEKVNIQKHVRFGKGDRISIGDHSGIGANSTIANGTTIGNYVMMATNCVILNRNHKFASKDIPMIFQGDSEIKNIVIEDDVWIGRDVLIMPGRHIKKGSIIAGGCVLTKDFPEYSIVGGNPSKLIRTR